MTTAVASRATPPSPPKPPSTSDATIDLRHVALDEATQRWLRDGDTPDNVAAFATALRDLLRAAST